MQSTNDIINNGLLQIWVYRLDFVADLGVYPHLLQIWVYVLRLVADLVYAPSDRPLR